MTVPGVTTRIISRFTSPFAFAGSSVCSQIAAEELTFEANLIQSRTFRAFEVYLTSTVMYLALAVAVRKFLHVFGKHYICRGRA